jgi:hypothetical protein
MKRLVGLFCLFIGFGCAVYGYIEYDSYEYLFTKKIYDFYPTWRNMAKRIQKENPPYITKDESRNYESIKEAFTCDIKHFEKMPLWEIREYYERVTGLYDSYIYRVIRYMGAKPFSVEATAALDFIRTINIYNYARVDLPIVCVFSFDLHRRLLLTLLNDVYADEDTPAGTESGKAKHESDLLLFGHDFWVDIIKLYTEMKATYLRNTER